MKNKCIISIICALSISAPLSWSWNAYAFSKEDQNILNKLAQGSRSEIQLGKLVASKTSQPAVKNFGKRMIEDHSAILKQLNQWAATNNATILETPGQEENKILNKISSLSGKEFDHQYIQGMLQDHNKDVAEIASYIDTHKGSSAIPVLRGTLPIVEDHLRIAENIAGQLGISPDLGLNQPNQKSSS